MSPKMWQLAQDAFTIARGCNGVVQEGSAVHYRGRLRVVQGVGFQRAVVGQVNHLHLVCKTRQHIKAIVRFIQYHTGRAAAGGDVVAAFYSWVEVCLKGCRLNISGIEYADFCRAEGCNV